MKQREQVLERRDINVARKTSYDLIDMILISLNNINIIAVFDRKWIVKRMSKYKQISLLIDSANFNNLLNIRFLCSLKQPVYMIFEAMSIASKHGYLEIVRYLYSIGASHPDSVYVDNKITHISGLSIFIYAIDTIIHQAFNRAYIGGHLEIVKFFHKVGLEYTINAT